MGSFPQRDPLQAGIIPKGFGLGLTGTACHAFTRSEERVRTLLQANRVLRDRQSWCRARRGARAGSETLRHRERGDVRLLCLYLPSLSPSPPLLSNLSLPFPPFPSLSLPFAFLSFFLSFFPSFSFFAFLALPPPFLSMTSTLTGEQQGVGWKCKAVVDNLGVAWERTPLKRAAAKRLLVSSIVSEKRSNAGCSWFAVRQTG